jgi:hypothetical protein
MMDEISDLILDITEAAKSDPDHVSRFQSHFHRVSVQHFMGSYWRQKISARRPGV